MNPRTAFRSILFVLVCAFITGPRPVSADASHARIIRLSFVQGDVRFSRDTHGDPLNDDKALWDAGVLNLPVRQGYVLATDHGRAEVEFENGAVAFLNENTVLEFYDLSIEDGARTTRLILRQGTASFSVASAKGDYFSVTGGDFTAEVTGRAAFRVDNFDDGSTVDVSKGHITVAHKKDSTPLDKGQALSMAAGQDSVQVSQANAPDEFDRWASGRVDSVTTATNASMRYANSPYYSSGFGDLYTYGSWFSTGGYGYGWRPYGVGLGWSPFDSGGWGFDPSLGWSFFGSAPWGWLPYHYGSWIFDPGFGWTWLPGGFGYGGYGTWRGATGTWVRSRNGGIGVVPVHPLDARGKTPINMARGVMPVRNGALGVATPVGADEKWKVLKSAPRESLKSNITVATAPTRVTRSVSTGGMSTGRFANNPGSGSSSVAGKRTVSVGQPNAVPARAPATPSARATAAPRRSINPPSVPRSTTAVRGGSSGASGGNSGSGRGFPSGASSRPSSSSAGSAPRGSSGAGGRPH